MHSHITLVRTVAAHLLLRRAGSILLIRRYKTGWEDGKYSVVAGHVDQNESAVEAMLREAWEEVGIRIEAENLEFVHVMHRRKPCGEEKMDVWFLCEEWEGEPQNAEPDKCDDLRWCASHSLPPNVIDYVRTALFLIGQGYTFSDYTDQELLHFAGANSRLMRPSALPTPLHH